MGNGLLWMRGRWRIFGRCRVFDVFFDLVRGGMDGFVMIRDEMGFCNCGSWLWVFMCGVY